MNNLERQKQGLFQHLTDLEVDVINTICDIIDVQVQENPRAVKDNLFLIGMLAFTSKLNRFVSDAGFSYSRPVDSRKGLTK